MQNMVGKNWHALGEAELLDLFETNREEGLSPFEVKHRRDYFGPNKIPAQKKESKLKIFFMQFHNALIYILLAASIITGALQEWVDSSVIFGVVIINVIVSYIQEVKAQEAIESLKQMMETEAIVIRDGKKIDIPSSELVPGDIVLLESGSKVPGDLRILELHDLRVDESMLTGESLPVQKSLATLDAETTLADRTNMLYSGTYVTYGRAKGVVIATGANTQIGKIAHLISETVAIETPLTRKIASFSKVLLFVILGLALFTFIVGLLRDYSAVEMFMASVALAVGAIPEGLPAAVTITLAIGVGRMAQKNAIIRKLPAVETLGSVTVICSDKTGTLTQNKMTVTSLYCDGNVYSVSGNGYSPFGEFSHKDEVLHELPEPLKQCVLAGYLCNESYLLQKEEGYEIVGDPTEGALIVSALKGGIDEYQTANDFPRLDILPFESDRQYMATLHQRPEGPNQLSMKGSAERVLELCDRMYHHGKIVPMDKDAVFKSVEQSAGSGLRVLAIAVKEITGDRITPKTMEEGFLFLGCQAMIDPPREEAIEAVKECKNAGIAVTMITGDHALTAFSIAKMMGIVKEDAVFDETVVRGKDLHTINDEALVKTVQEIRVFARVEPEQKLRIVDALQAQGEVVAMTGDGVNDAPALKQADIGVAMGKSGTEVAKEAADMILSDDNFSSIAKAVREGRNVFDNLVKFITWTLPTNLGEGLVILASIMLGLTLPILPLQILWINMSTAILLGLMLVFEPDESNIMRRPPRNPATPFLTPELVLRMIVVGVYMLIASYFMFRHSITQGYSVEYARTVAVNIFVFTELFYLFSCKELQKSIFKTNLLNNGYLLVGVFLMTMLQMLYTYVPVMNTLFKSEPITAISWLKILSIAASIILIIEIQMLLSQWFRKKRPKKNSRRAY